MLTAHHGDTVEASSFEAAVRHRVGLMDGPRFRRAMRETIRALAGHVGLPLARLDAVLPPELRGLLGDVGLGPVDPTATYGRVASAARMHVAIALEVVRAVVAEIGERLGPDGRDELRGVLPREWADLVVEPATAGSNGTRE